MTLRGPDIASYQKGLNLLTLPDADFVLTKCTEGASYVDPYYTAWLGQAQRAGMIFIPYHFITVADSAAAQAENMRAHVGDTTLPWMLDIETEYGKAPTLALVTNIIDEAHLRGLRVKLAYLPKWFWQQNWGSADLKPLRDRGVALVSSNYPGASGTGLAQYEADGGDGGVGWAPYGGMTPAMWQYTDAANEQGQAVDYNAFKGAKADLVQLLGEPVADNVGNPTGWHRTLSLGAGGDDVRAVQALLTALGYDPQGVDGIFGQQTQAAVEHAQSAWQIAKDGVVGPQTYGAIHAHLGTIARPPALLQIGMHGLSIQIVQAMLWLLGFDPAGIDGIFGERTATAVVRFQNARAIAKDGVVGPVTWAQLTAAN